MYFMILFIQRRECPYKGIRYREIPLYIPKKEQYFPFQSSYIVLNYECHTAICMGSVIIVSMELFDGCLAMHT